MQSFGEAHICTACGLQESWVIGNPGDYTSVSQALGGTGLADFYLTGPSGEFGGNAQPTPEPGSMMLLATGVLGGFGKMRRSRQSVRSLPVDPRCAAGAGFAEVVDRDKSA